MIFEGPRSDLPRQRGRPARGPTGSEKGDHAPAAPKKHAATRSTLQPAVSPLFFDGTKAHPGLEREAGPRAPPSRQGSLQKKADWGSFPACPKKEARSPTYSRHRRGGRTAGTEGGRVPWAKILPNVKNPCAWFGKIKTRLKLLNDKHETLRKLKIPIKWKNTFPSNTFPPQMKNKKGKSARCLFIFLGFGDAKKNRRPGPALSTCPSPSPPKKKHGGG